MAHVAEIQFPEDPAGIDQSPRPKDRNPKPRIEIVTMNSKRDWQGERSPMEMGQIPFLYDATSETVYLGEDGSWHQDMIGHFWPDGTRYHKEFKPGRVHLGDPAKLEWYPSGGEWQPEEKTAIRQLLRKALKMPIEQQAVPTSWNDTVFSYRRAFMRIMAGQGQTLDTFVEDWMSRNSPWRRGKPGKGIVDVGGRVHTWNTTPLDNETFDDWPDPFTAFSYPHHTEAAQYLGVAPRHYFEIQPGGSYSSNVQPFPEDVHRQIQQHNPELQPQRNDEWEFESKVSENGRKAETLGPWDPPSEYQSPGKEEDQINWTPGEYGKGFISEQGPMHTWNVTPEGSPSHWEYGDANTPHLIPETHFLIHPDGALNDPMGRLDHERAQKVVERDPRLRNDYLEHPWSL